MLWSLNVVVNTPKVISTFETHKSATGRSNHITNIAILIQLEGKPSTGSTLKANWRWCDVMEFERCRQYSESDINI